MGAAWANKRYVSGKTKPEVRQKLRKLLEELDAGLAYDSEGLTVERYMDRWLESIHDKVRPGTFKPYEAITRLHIKPTLGSTKLEKLSALQLENFYRQKLNEGLSARRVRYIHVTVRKALKDAVRLQLLSRNVADAAIPQRPVKQEIEPLTQEQMRSLLDAARGDKLECLNVLAITTGMRQGELLGLQWKDIDLDTVTLKAFCKRSDPFAKRAFQHAPAFGFRFSARSGSASASQHASAFKASLVSISAFLFSEARALPTSYRDQSFRESV
jgi:integrase